MTFGQVAILDDDALFCNKVKEALSGQYVVTVAISEAEFRKVYRPLTFDLVLLDMRLRQDREGLDVLREIYEQDELQPVIMCSAYGDAESAVAAVGAGAMMFLRKQEFSPELLGRMATAVIEQGRWRRRADALRRMVWEREPDTLVGQSVALREAAEALREAISSPDRIPLVTGERGTGRTLAATLIHRHGERRDGPFFETDGARLHDPKAFFGGKRSPWVLAGAGTLAIDGAGILSGKEADALTERLSEGTGPSGNGPGVVLLSATARSGGVEASALVPRWLDAFRPLVVRLPPLRKRREDVALLAAHFLQTQRAGGHTAARSFSSRALERLERHDWPGNVRELRNAVEYALLLASTAGSSVVEEAHLPAGILTEDKHGNASAAINWDFRLNLARSELGLLERAIAERGLSRKSELQEALGYSDRFMLGRRVGKALGEFPGLAAEYPGVAALFTAGGGR